MSYHTYLRVVDVDGASLSLSVEAEELLTDGLGEVQRHVQRADDPGVSVGQEILHTAVAAATATATGGEEVRVDGGGAHRFSIKFTMISYEEH